MDRVGRAAASKGHATGQTAESLSRIRYTQSLALNRLAIYLNFLPGYSFDLELSTWPTQIGAKHTAQPRKDLNSEWVVNINAPQVESSSLNFC